MIYYRSSIQITWVWVEWRIYKGLTAGLLSRLFTDEGIVGSIDAIYHEFIDTISPFLGAIVEMFWGDLVTDPVTSVFLKFVKMADYSWLKNKLLIWSEEDLKEFWKLISGYKVLGLKKFGDYKASSMATIK